jgi:hypothetical protein
VTDNGGMSAQQPLTVPPRLWLNAMFHTEMLDDDGVYAGMVAFCRSFRDLTGVQPWLCVMTPECHRVKERIRAAGFSPDRYAERILALGDVAEIGFHGHAFLPNGDRMVGAHFRPEAALPQFERELAWLKAIGVTPRVYTGGWWILTPELLAMLAGHGFVLDGSTRGPLTNEYGNKYPDDLPSVGERFALNPAVTEIGSLPYFKRPWPYYLAMLQESLPEWGRLDRWAVLPLHDYDRPEARGHDLRIIERLAAHPAVGWLTVEQALLPAGTLAQP